MELRRQVLSAFYKLHRTRKQVFNGDAEALKAAREKINSEFRKHLNEKDSEKIKELLVVANDAERILRTSVVQAKLTDEGTYSMKLTKDSHLEENIPFREDATIPKHPRRKKCPDS